MTTAWTEELAISDMSIRHQRNEDYSFRLPAPPRIISPPPTLSSDLPDFGINGVLQPHDNGPDVSFLNEVDFSNIVHISTVLEWTYEKRRSAQMILPFLYLGPMVAAKDKDFITREGITMVLGIRQRAPALQGALRAADEMNIASAAIDAPDMVTLSASFSAARRAINQHLSDVNARWQFNPSQPRLGKVLVFCESGNERSAAVVAAYLMEMLNDLDYIKAMQLCQAQRFCVNFDDNIKHILKAYWDILSARRSVGQPVPPQFNSSLQLPGPNGIGNNSQMPQITRKRSLNEVSGDVEMSESPTLEDQARFEGRVYAPFTG